MAICNLVVGLDTASKKVCGDSLSFIQRFIMQVGMILCLLPDVITLQEIRGKENKKIVREKLKEKGYESRFFHNNDSDNTFYNCIGIRSSNFGKDCSWKEVGSKHYWTTIDDAGVPCLSENKDARIPAIPEKGVEGDEWGRCVGVTVLQHKTSLKKVIVASIHVVPFGETKVLQQKACLSLANMTRGITGEAKDCPVIIAGDFNFFDEERKSKSFKDWEDYVLALNLRETPLKRMEISGINEKGVIEDESLIGTYTPWSTDKYAHVIYKQPLGYSKLNAIFASNELQCKDGVTVQPILMKHLNELSKMTPEEKKTGMDELRFRLKDILASDHFLMSAEFTLSGHQ
ncbi:unnamed protein product [Owenia fusiformis]|uniref:Endonuclease/exonuclease/phosphatase domain-containing protein n=1 Tax=Owenia fusiformis TaxID=6347 RepID=A0A8S4N6C6_OWEFU|nr:unnamed protein product [Owenia fusiformis]